MKAAARRATQTREIDFITRFLRELMAAYSTWDYSAVEEMIHPEAVLTTRQSEQKGTDPIIRHLKEMGKRRFRTQIVAPKGGLVTVLITPVVPEGPRPVGVEQTYRILNDRLVGLIDFGRTPDMVYRPESQPF